MTSPDGGDEGLRVAVSLWSVPEAERAAELARLVAGGVRRVHWDVSDGDLAAPGGFDPEGVAQLVASLPPDAEVAHEVHLMVRRPVEHVPAWTDLCDTVVVHVEAEGWREAVDAVRGAGRRAAVAVSPGTPLDEVRALGPDVGVLVMSVVPGQAGSGFLPTTYDRLDALAGRPLLGVDGSVDLERGARCHAHGATWLVSGTSLCGCPDPARWLEQLARPGMP
ncbi:hypothetical protein [Cellulomonas endophytica]|uniref:hypothetical protein n=1 Tax=Cellulomonas endophytica TaxID=2494735 RepID=UPI0010104EF7|nr:hypothetical protein [Cellulomonas endophytica]